MLWFKNLIIYRFNKALTLNSDEIAQQLTEFRFTYCSRHESSKMGWVAPMGNGSEELAYVVGEHLLLSSYKEEKILPTSVIKQTLQAKIDQLETEQARKLKKTEKEHLKDEVLHTLLPRAFSRFSKTMIWINLQKGLVIVDAASHKRAEEALALLRKNLGSLPVIPFTPEQPIENSMTHWLKNNRLPAPFQMGEEAELKAILDGGGIIRCKEQNLVSKEIIAHLSCGKQVTKLAMNWQDRIQFLLTDEGSLKRLKFSDDLRAQHDDIDREDYRQRFDADFTLMIGELTLLIDDLIEQLH